MATIRCRVCRAKHPASGKAFMHVPAPGSERCKQCGADLLEQAVEEITRVHIKDLGPEKLLELGHLERQSRDDALLALAELHERMGRADEAVRDREQALHELDARIRSHAGEDGMQMVAMIQWRARLRESMGQQIEAVRDELLAADVLAAGAGDAAGRTAAGASLVGAGLGGLASGLEFAAAFKGAYQRDLLKMAAGLRQELLSDGRAVGLGACAECGQVVAVTGEGRCPAGHQVAQRRYGPAQDAEVIRAELTAGLSAQPADAATTPASWYPDPSGRHQHRWFDGSSWTAHVADDQVVSTDPV